MTIPPSQQPTLDLEPEAVGDLNEIYLFFLTYTPIEYAQGAADEALDTIRSELLKIASNPLISGENVHGLEKRYRLWYVLERRYKVYFERLGPNHINVLRIYGSRRAPLRAREILRSMWRPVSPTIPNVPKIEPETPPLKTGRTRVQPKTMADFIEVAPTNSPEYIIFKGLGAGVSAKSILARIDWLQTKAKRLHTAEYKRVAIAYLQEELAARGQQTR